MIFFKSIEMNLVCKPVWRDGSEGYVPLLSVFENIPIHRYIFMFYLMSLSHKISVSEKKQSRKDAWTGNTHMQE